MTYQKMGADSSYEYSIGSGGFHIALSKLGEFSTPPVSFTRLDAPGFVLLA